MAQIITNNSGGGGGGAGVYIYKGSVNSYSDLPSSGLKVGDVYNVVNEHTTAPKFPAGSNVAWTGTEWDVLGGTFDLSEYQKKLVEGTGIDIDGDTNEISVDDSIVSGASAGSTAVQPGDLATVATSGDYDDLLNKPTIPTVNNATLTIQKNSTDVATFTANASSNVTANISVPTDTGDLTNGAGFITNSALSGYQTTANLVTDLTNPDDTHYPSALAVKNAITAGGNGDVSGPASSVDGDVVLFDGISGKLIKDSGVTLGTAASKDTGTSSGNVPVLDSNGKLNKSTLPGVALTDTFTVSTSSDLTSLSSAEQGDLAIVTTESKTYVLSAEPYSTAANWKEILSPTGGVTSVNSQTGVVTLDADDISDSTTTNKFVTATDKSTWSGKQDALTLPATPTQGNLVTWGANNKTLVDGGAIPSTADCVKTSGDQTIAGTKTFSTSPVVPNKTSDATNTGTAIATEAQVYKKADASDVNTKTFTLSSTSDLVNAQAAFDWIKSGKNVILRLATNNREYPFLVDDTNGLIFKRANNIDVTDDTGSASIIDAGTITLYYSGDTVTSIVKGHESTYQSVLLTDLDYATPYTPQYDGSPATKKYVDDHGVPSGGNNGDVLTNVSGTPTWSAPSGGDVVISSQSGNILTSGTKLRAGTEADYSNLGSYDSGTIYLTI